jgi:ribosomal protein S18 acetylase RimI-like enzyme
MELSHFTTASGLAAMRFSDIRYMLDQTYWGPEYSDETIHRFLEHSLDFGVFEKETGRQIAFARAVTDYATLYYVSDVVVDPGFRRQGVGTLLMDTLIHHPELKGMRGMLITKDAQALYRKSGFQEYAATFMDRTEK